MTNATAPERLLICEGKDDKLFLAQLLGQLNIHVEIRTASRTELNGYVKTWQQAGHFKHLKKVAIVRDADFQPIPSCLRWEHYETERKTQQHTVTSAFKSVCSALTSLEKDVTFKLKMPTKPGQVLTEVPRAGVFILPDNAHAGALEDLVIAALPQAQRQCIEQYLICAGNERPLNRYHKTIVYSWLAAYAKEPEQRLGEAASQMPLDAPCFEPLKQFLQQFYA